MTNFKFQAVVFALLLLGYFHMDSMQAKANSEQLAKGVPVSALAVPQN